MCLKSELPKLIGFVVFLGVVGLLVKGMVDRHSVFRPIRIGEISSATNSFQFNWPKAETYHFVIGVNVNGEWAGGTLDGHLDLQAAESPSVRLLFSPETVTNCNWLDRERLTGIILNWTTNLIWEDKLIPNRTCHVSLVFSSAVPTNSSLWLCVAQTHREWRNYKE